MELVFLLSAYGAAHLFTEQYLPFLTAKTTDQPPPLVRLLGQLPIIWERKPWSCKLCLSFWIAAALRLAWMPWSWTLQPLVEPIAFGFGAVATAYVIEEWLRYLRLEI